jgi:putative pyruvate formate lyase activating enzyme
MNATKKVEKIETALARLSGHAVDCRLCPRECRVNRTAGEKGFCESGERAAVSHALLHFGEEPVLSGQRDAAQGPGPDCRGGSGSGTIFFAGCNLKCSFCQNYQLSWLGQGREVEDDELAELILGLQAKGALNINLVSPTHFILPILRALGVACQRGLTLPVVWNSSGYEKSSVLALLDGIVDIYLPDFKYASTEAAARYSGAADYFKHAGEAIKEMFFQRPLLVIDPDDIAQQGMIIRHLVLPGQVQNSLGVLDWIARELGTSAPLSLMSQYQPCFEAPEELRRPLHAEEYHEVLARAQALGFEQLFIQPEVFAAEDHLVPDFSRGEPFNWGGHLGKKEKRQE